MIITEINRDKLIKNLDSFKDMYGRKPYIICNEKTMQEIKSCKEEDYRLVANGIVLVNTNVNKLTKSIKVGDAEYNQEGDEDT